MANNSRRRLTDQERDDRRRADRKRLQESAEQLLSLDGWQRWVRVRSHAGLGRLSLSNQLLVALARPDATFVAGFKAWLKLGYCVKKGERAIAIIAPLPVKDRDKLSGEETGRETRLLFRTVFVFDRQQVAPLPSGSPTPLEPPCEPVTGDSHAHLLEPLQRFAESIGFSVSFESIPGSTGGWCDAKARRIVIDADAPRNAQLRILVHETVHAMGVGYAEHGRARAEVIVDTVTYLACSSIGLDVSGESIPYVAGWGQDGALEAVSAFARTIDQHARRLEDVLAPRSVEERPCRASLPSSAHTMGRVLRCSP
jgi:hypothetical protein